MAEPRVVGDDWMVALRDREDDGDGSVAAGGSAPATSPGLAWETDRDHEIRGGRPAEGTNAGARGTWAAGGRRLTSVLCGALAVETLALLAFVVFRPSRPAAVVDLPASALSASPTAVTPTPGAAAPKGAGHEAKALVVSARGDGAFTTIAEALRRAAPGATITVKPGRYREKLVIETPVELVGEGPRDGVVVESGSGTVLTIKAERAKVRGLTLVRGEGVAEEDAYAIDVPQGQVVLEDCAVSSKSTTCVLVHGASADPVFRRCVISDCSGAGLSFGDGARGLVDDCEFRGNGAASLLVKKDARPDVRHCRFANNKGNAVFVTTRGRGTFEDCTVTGAASLAVAVSEGAIPVFRDCKILDGKDAGVQASEGGMGTFERCEVRGNVTGVIVSASSPNFLDCTVSGNRNQGVLALSNAAGSFVRCELRENGLGASVKSQSVTLFRECRFIDSKGDGVQASEKGAGVFEGGEVSGSGGVGLVVKTEADPVFRGVKVRGGKATGVAVLELGRGVFEGCEVGGHPNAAVAVAAGGRPTLRRCKVVGTSDVGLLFRASGGGVVEGCDVQGFAAACVSTEGDASPAFRDCRISDSKKWGVLTAGGGSYSDCEISRNVFVNLLALDSTATFERCKLHASKSHGAVVAKKSRLTFTDCEVFENEGDNVQVGNDATLTLVRCKLSKGKGSGLWVTNAASAAAIDCQVFDNAVTGVLVAASGRCTVQGGAIRSNQGAGLLARDGTSPAVVGCELTDNVLGGVYAMGDSKPSLQDCRVTGGPGYGLWVKDRASLQAERCRVFETGKEALNAEGGAVLLRSCTLEASKTRGVSVTGPAKVELVTCELIKNQGAGASLSGGGQLTARDTRFTSNTGPGAEVAEKGSGVFTNSFFQANGGAGLVNRGNGVLSAQYCRLLGNDSAAIAEEGATVTLTGCFSVRNLHGDWLARTGGRFKGGRDNQPALPAASEAEQP